MSYVARRLRLRRLYHHEGGLLVLACDGSLTGGPQTRAGQSLAGVVRCCAGPVDAVVVHAGVVRHLDVEPLQFTSVIVQVSGGTCHSVAPDDKTVLASVDEAVRVGADAVAVQLNLGSDSEQRQLGEVARVSAQCEALAIPLLAMVYPRGPRISNQSPELIRHAVSIAADLGADLVKVPMSADPRMAEIAGDSPIPVLVAGGPSRNFATLANDVWTAMRWGAGGVAVGRNVLGAEDPASIARGLSRLVHGPEHARAS